ncbi:MAG: nucleotide exchange factor GrpE [Bacilli bacterium]|nr:nucleotide exchange factor GrpE [Bacilli bacterium]
MENEEILQNEVVEEQVEDEKQHKHHKHDNKKEKLLEEKIALLEEAVKNEQDKNLRLNAEVQNIQRHREEDIQRLLKYEGEELIKAILPIVDNFERALSMENETNQEFLTGFKMIYKKLIEILDNNQVSIIDQKDVEFDPAIHQAVATEQVEGVKDNMVLDVLQKGYKYKDKLLRPAMVKVSM